jgi:hypothetical protein
VHSWADGKGPLTYSPSWMVLTSLAVAVLARLDFRAVQQSLHTLRAERAQLLIERQALAKQLDEFKPQRVDFDSGVF